MPILAFGWITHSWCRISLLLLLSMGSPLLLLLLLWLPTGSPVMPAPEHESLVALKSCLVPALCLSLLVQALTPHPESLQHKQAHNLHHILKAYNTDTQFTPHPESWQHKQAHNSHHILKAYNTNRHTIHTTSWKLTTQTGTQFTPHPESLQHRHTIHTTSWKPTTQSTPHPESLQYNSHHILIAYKTIYTTSWKPTTQTGTQFTPHPERLHAHHILKDFMHTTSWKCSRPHLKAFMHITSWKPSRQTGNNSHSILKALMTNGHTIYATSWKASRKTGAQFTPHPKRLQDKEAHNLRHILKVFRTNNLCHIVKANQMDWQPNHNIS